MLGRAGIRILRRHKKMLYAIDNKRQKALALIVRGILMKAGYHFQPDMFDDLEGANGFSVGVSIRFNSTTSVSVGCSPEFTDRSASLYAEAIVDGLQTVIGKTAAARLVEVKQRRLPLKGQGVTDAHGKPLDHLDFVDVTVTVPDDATLRKLYARLGRQ